VVLPGSCDLAVGLSLPEKDAWDVTVLEQAHER
jgi:hypothetical protein